MADPEALPLAGPPFTPAALFVCTYVARLAGGEASVPDLTRALCRSPGLAAGAGPLLAVNSNFGHAAAPGFAGLLKAPAGAGDPDRRHRKAQGDGSCFNSSVEPVIRLALADLPPDKVYKVKFFPTTGQTQIPGVLRRDLSDGHLVLEAFVGALRDAGYPGVRIESERPKMLNFKFCLRRRGGRALIDIRALGAFVALLEARRGAAGLAAADRAAFGAAAAPLLAGGAGADALLEARCAFAGRAAGGAAGERAAAAAAAAALALPGLGADDPLRGVTELLAAAPPAAADAAAAFAAAAEACLPHVPVREVRLPTDDVKVSFKFVEASGARPRVNVFQEGKVNILGADSFESAQRIYSFFEALFFHLWPCFVRAAPRRDGEPPAPRPPPPPPPLDPEAARWFGDLLAALEAEAAEKAGEAAPGPAPPAPAPPAAPAPSPGVEDRARAQARIRELLQAALADDEGGGDDGGGDDGGSDEGGGGDGGGGDGGGD